MGAASGPIKKIIWGNKNIVLSNDNEVNFWRGGWVNTEVNQDIGGQSPKQEFIGGMLTGVTSRCVEPGSLDDMYQLVYATTAGDVDITVEAVNGDKWTAPCFATVDPTAFFNNQDGKATFNLYPRKGEWSPL